MHFNPHASCEARPSRHPFSFAQVSNFNLHASCEARHCARIAPGEITNFNPHASLRSAPGNSPAFDGQCCDFNPHAFCEARQQICTKGGRILLSSFSSLRSFRWHFLLTPRVYHHFSSYARCEGDGHFSSVALRTAFSESIGNEMKNHAFLSANGPILQIRRKRDKNPCNF